MDIFRKLKNYSSGRYNYCFQFEKHSFLGSSLNDYTEKMEISLHVTLLPDPGNARQQRMTENEKINKV